MARLIGTAGHVDHGKTALIAALTGIDADRLPEEKQRGMTIDLGFAYLDIPPFGRVSIVDVPGHEKFLSNMLVGALGMDVALLCVDSAAGISKQTLEHFSIIQLLPVNQMVIAITKIDVATLEQIEACKLALADLLEETRFKGSEIVDTSANTGAGMAKLKDALAQSLAIGNLPRSGDFYLPIDRAFTVAGYGPVVTGTVGRGSLKVGDDLDLLPEGKRVRAKGLEIHGVKAFESETGLRTAINLSGVDVAELRRGQLLAKIGTAFASNRIDVTLSWRLPPKHGERVRLSIGSDEVMGRIYLNDAQPSLAQLRLERATAATAGQPVLIRKYSPAEVMAGGQVLVPMAAARRKSAEASIGGDILEIVSLAPQGVATELICQQLGKAPQLLGHDFEKLQEEGRIVSFAGLWMTPGNFETCKGILLKALSELHEKQPTVAFLPRDLVFGTAGFRWSGKPLDRIIQRLANDGVIEAQGTLLRRVGHTILLSEKQRRLLDQVKGVLETESISVPSPRDIAAKIPVPTQAVDQVLELGQNAGEMVCLTPDVFYTHRQLDQLRRDIEREFGRAFFTAAEFRDRFGTSRKYAIPLLEYFDRIRFTQRTGEKRAIR